MRGHRACETVVEGEGPDGVELRCHLVREAALLQREKATLVQHHVRVGSRDAVIDASRRRIEREREAIDAGLLVERSPHVAVSVSTRREVDHVDHAVAGVQVRRPTGPRVRSVPVEATAQIARHLSDHSRGDDVALAGDGTVVAFEMDRHRRTPHHR